MEKNINDYYAEGIFPEEIDAGITEGHKRAVTAIYMKEALSLATNVLKSMVIIVVCVI